MLLGTWVLLSLNAAWDVVSGVSMLATVGDCDRREPVWPGWVEALAQMHTELYAEPEDAYENGTARATMAWLVLALGAARGWAAWVHFPLVGLATYLFEAAWLVGETLAGRMEPRKALLTAGLSLACAGVVWVPHLYGV